MNSIIHGDAKEELKKLDSDSIDSIVTDPPYGYSFMNKDWDKAVVSVDIWKECLRVLKSGAFAFIMSSPRQDVLSRMIVNLQNAGFETNFTSIYWTYASGFPKAANVSKLVDKRLGAEREIIGYNPYTSQNITNNNYIQSPKTDRENKPITKSATEAAKRLDGSYAGFQPKPALETILVVMKPLSEKSFVDQALKNGKGCTWLDDCRIPFQNNDLQIIKNKQPKDLDKWKIKENGDIYGNGKGLQRPNIGEFGNEKGRFPANLLVSDDSLNDGKITGGKTHFKNGKGWNNSKIYGSTAKGEGFISYEDKGSYSRYFDLDAWYSSQQAQFIITPKASAGERNKGLENSETQVKRIVNNQNCKYCPECNIKYANSIMICKRCGNALNITEVENKARSNFHPTVKPIKLCSYLITMGSRPNDIILDPFCGSGTTLIAAHQLHRRYIGIELNKEYVEIARKRIEPLNKQKTLLSF